MAAFVGTTVANWLTAGTTRTTPTRSITAGNTAICLVSWEGGVTLNGVADSDGAYTLAVQLQNSLGEPAAAIYYRLNHGGGASIAATATFASSAAQVNIALEQFSGGSGGLDGTASDQSASGPPFSTPSIATTGAGFVVYWVAGYALSITAVDASTPTFTLDTGAAEPSDGDTIIAGYLISGSGQTVTPGASWASSAARWVMVAAAFKDGGGGGGPAIVSTSSATPANGSLLTITVTGAGSARGEVDVGGALQEVRSWTDTSITVLLARNESKYGVGVNLVARDATGAASAPYALTSIQPQAGWSFVNLTSIAGTGVIDAVPGLAIGDQVAYDDVGGTVEVFADGTYSAENTVTSFGVEAWTPGGGWGIVALQTFPLNVYLWDTSVQSGNDVWLRNPIEAAASSGITAVAADTITFGDSAAALTTRVAAASDTLTLTDSAAAITTRVAIAADTFTPSDSAIASSTLVAVASDTVAFTDSAVAVNAFEAVGSDTVSFTDSAVAITSLVAAASDTLTLTDSAEAITTRVAAASDTLTLTDSAVAVSTLVAIASDTISFSDSGVASVGAGAHTAIAADTISLSDSAVATSTLVAAASDSVTFTDSAVGSSQYPAVAADTVAFSDSGVALTTSVADASDSLALSDSAAAITTLVSAGTDSISFSDSAIASSTLTAVASDTISFSDSADASALTGVIFADAGDTIIFFDSAQGFTFTPPAQSGTGGMVLVAGGPDEGAAGYRERWRDEERAKIAANNAFIMSLVGALMFNGDDDEEEPP